MKNLTALCVLLTSAFFATAASAADAPKQESFPPHVIGNSQLRVLPVNAAGRHYQLSVGLPASYNKDTQKRYPVVYVTDGYWDFAKITTDEGSLVYDKVTPEFITVGLGYAGENLDYGNLRRWELTPIPFGDKGEASGHAADFLKTIETEIIPLIDREYRTDTSYRVLAGASLGGLFTLYSMYSKPDLFQAYIASTPAVTLSNDWLFGYEDEFIKAGKTIKARLYMAVGGNEEAPHVAGIKRFNDRIVSRHMGSLAYEFRVIDGERHAGMQIETYVRGLRFAFLPLAPQTGPSKMP